LHACRASALPTGSQFFADGRLAAPGVPHAVTRTKLAHADARSLNTLNMLVYILCGTSRYLIPVTRIARFVDPQPAA
jgi:hypothetical protein